MSVHPIDLLVVGAGPAGLTAGLYGHRSELSVLILGGDTPGGQVTRHYNVENFPGFPGGVTGAELMIRWLKQVIDEIGVMPQAQSVDSVDFREKVKKVVTTEGSYHARAVVVATGSSPRRLGVPGEAEFEGKGVFHCATCDAPLLRTMDRQRAAVVGGGDSAIHTSLALLPHAESVAVVTRGPALRAKPGLLQRFTDDPKSRIIVQRTVTAVTGDERATALALENTQTKEKEALEVEAVFVGIGQTPVTGFLNGALELDEQGFIVTDGLLRTSIPGVFAAGDVRTTPLRQIVTAAADGALAAHVAAEYVRMSTW